MPAVWNSYSHHNEQNKSRGPAQLDIDYYEKSYLICLKVKVAKQTYVRSTNDYHRGQNKEVGKDIIHTTDIYSNSKRYTIETQKMKLKKKRYGIK